MTKAIELSNHGEKITIKLPHSWKLLGQITPPDSEVLESPKQLLLNALNNLIGVPNLRDLIRNKKSVVIISDDKSRPTPTNIIIPLLLNVLNEAGISDSQIKIIVGRGLHPSLTRTELKEKFGSEVLQRVHILDHNPTQNLTFIGRTTQGTDVFVNSEVTKADLKIGLGSILPHELAGYTGGSGIIIPGVAGQETINQNHCLVGTFEAEFGKLEGNAIREDMEESAKLLGLDMIINTILNSRNEILDIVAGDPVKAHHQGVSLSKKVYGVKIPKLADIIIASAFPRGSTFGKAIKALFAASLALKDEGTIILLAPCEQGISSSSIFQEMLLKNPSSDMLFQYIEKGELPGESCVLYLFAKVKQYRIIVVTDGVSPAEIQQMGLEHAPDLNTAIQNITHQSPDVIIFPKAAITLPILR